MIQERTENKKRTPRNDLLLIIGLLALIVLARYIMTAVRTLPYGGPIQIVVFLLILLMVYGIYKKVLIDYRYTLTYQAPAPDDLDAFGTPKQPEHPLGSLLVERMLADKGKVYEQVLPQEYVCLCKPGAQPTDISQAEAAKCKTLHLTTLARAQACALYFRRDGALYKLLFSPSEAFFNRLSEVIAQLRA